VGDDAFLAGMRHFYTSSRFSKAGTEDLRRAMELASNRSLERFFDNWVYGSTLPDLRFSYRVETENDRQVAVLRLEQRGEIFDVPVTVALQYTDHTVHVPVNVTDQIVETRVPLDGPLRSARVRDDDGTLAEIRRP
jgi:aminopeptidase N